MNVHAYAAHKLQRMGRRFRKWSWKWRIRCGQRATVKTQQGRFTVFTRDQVIGRHLYIHREFESHGIASSLALLRSTGYLTHKGTGTVLDVGANLGVISIGMLRQREFARAVAIEPCPDNFELLQANARQNQLGPDRYQCVHAGLSDQSGTLQFELSEHNFGDHRIRVDGAVLPAAQEERYHESARRTIDVTVRTLDDLLASIPAAFANDISLVWMDTQGHEGRIIAGGAQTFARNVPVVCEVWPYGIARAGQSAQQFIDLVRANWRYYWVWRRGRTFVKYPTSILSSLFDELGNQDEFDNVIFTN